MKKLLLILFFIFSISPVHARWVGISEQDNVSTYIEANSIRHRGKVSSYWTLYDYSSIQTNGVFSKKVKWEDNCETEEHRILSIVNYSEKMGAGNVIPSPPIEYDRWDHIVPGTIGDFYHKFVCSQNIKKK